MKLLLDENISYRIVPSLQTAYPGSTHVKLIGYEQVDDITIWEFAKKESFVIVTKDDDFQSLLSMNGHPPKVIHLITGNNSNSAVIDTLLLRKDIIINALEDTKIGLVSIL